MLIFIISTIAILYIVLVMYMYNSLKGIGMSKAIACIIASILIILLITFFIFINIYNGIDIDDNAQKMKDLKTIIINAFAPVNGLLILPHLFKNIIKYNEEKISKELLIKKIIIRLIILIIFIIFERMYIKSAILYMLQQV